MTKDSEFHVKGGLYVNGKFCPVTNIFDAYGDDTDDVEQAASIVVLVNDQWMVFDVSNTGIYRVH